MARPKRWIELDIIDGVGEIQFPKWRYFIEFVHQEMLDYKTYIWRGQRCSDWQLKTTIDRLIADAQRPLTKVPGFRESHLEQFKDAVRGRRGPNPAEIKLENE